jgi:hypothetical protein
MKFCRLYSGPHERSHLESSSPAARPEFFNTTRSATGLLFRDDLARHVVNFHKATRRRWVITLAGRVDIGLGDGTTVSFYPGDVFLAEDTTGQGHIATPHDPGQGVLGRGLKMC